MRLNSQQHREIAKGYDDLASAATLEAKRADWLRYADNHRAMANRQDTHPESRPTFAVLSIFF